MPRKKLALDKSDTNSQSSRLGQFGSAITQICEEKGIAKEKVIEAIEAALAAAYKKDYGKKGQHIRAEFNEVTGEYKFFLVKEVVDETTRLFEKEDEKIKGDTAVKGKIAKEKKIREGAEEKPIGEYDEVEEKLPRFNPERDILFSEALEKDPNAKVGDIIEEELEVKKDYGRVAAQTAKQVIIQRIREAERDAMYSEYKQKEGEVLSGVVQRIEGKNVFVDLGKSTGIMFPSEQVEGERYRIGQRLKVYVVKVEADTKGPGILLSRSHPMLVQKLFEIEVPEIFANTIEIKAIARESGSRTKIAVASNEEGVDPIGSCVGQKGTRVQAVIDELGGEKIDIIEWSDDVAKFIANALSPAKVLSTRINEKAKEAKITVPPDQLSLAIGKQGQNVRLAAKLTGWKIDVVAETKKSNNNKQSPSEFKNDSKDEDKKKDEASTKDDNSNEKKEKQEADE